MKCRNLTLLLFYSSACSSSACSSSACSSFACSSSACSSPACSSPACSSLILFFLVHFLCPMYRRRCSFPTGRSYTAIGSLMRQRILSKFWSEKFRHNTVKIANSLLICSIHSVHQQFCIFSSEKFNNCTETYSCLAKY